MKCFWKLEKLCAEFCWQMIVEVFMKYGAVQKLIHIQISTTKCCRRFHMHTSGTCNECMERCLRYYDLLRFPELTIRKEASGTGKSAQRKTGFEGGTGIHEWWSALSIGCYFGSSGSLKYRMALKLSLLVLFIRKGSM